MKLFEMMVNHKINHIQPDELLALARQHQVALTQDQAVKITKLLNGKNINIFHAGQRQQVINQIAAITGVDTARQIEMIFRKLTNNF
ncbi:DUF2624 family protein [Bacillus massiliglaciei]|uniref:DUF2624 family protein n=1 Tax=Bacillus massiliglaciei TaxID=1816693 RepID=UPI0018FE1AB9|nr:DUF2624 family protein [Bacillus massiliglaciei]